jgi:uncharacterized protein YbdZ (MbtH family)
MSSEPRDDQKEQFEQVVAGWMTKHDLWPHFCAVDEVKVVRAGESERVTHEQV